MSNEKVYSVAVIGGGSAGTMSALRSVLNNNETLFFPGTGKDKKRSRAMWVSKVENMPGYLKYKKGIEEPNKESLDWLAAGEFKEKFHWLKNRGVSEIEKQGDLFKIADNKGESYLAQYVILCTGIMDVQPKINREISEIFPFANAQSADYCLRCDGHHIYQKDTAVIGHSSGAAWVAVMLYERYSCLTCYQMYVLTNGEKPDFSEEVKDLLELYQIPVIEAPIVQVLGDTKKGQMEGILFEDGKSVNIQMAFVSLGMIVYNELAKSLGAALDERGFVKTDQYGESNVKGLYVAGDLRANTRKQIYTAYDTAVDAADRINALLRKDQRESMLKEKRG